MNTPFEAIEGAKRKVVEAGAPADDLRLIVPPCKYQRKEPRVIGFLFGMMVIEDPEMPPNTEFLISYNYKVKVSRYNGQ
jgi:hypothetical protein